MELEMSRNNTHPIGALPTFQPLLSDETVEEFTMASFKVLNEVGLIVENEEVRQRLGSVGGFTNRGNHAVCFPTSTLMDFTASPPDPFVLRGLGAGQDVHIGSSGQISCRTLGGARLVSCAPGDQTRPSTIEDIRGWVRIADCLDEIEIVGCLCPSDVPAPMQDLWALRMALENTRKPIMINPMSSRSVPWLSRMLSAASERAGPRVIILASVSSPLHFSEDQLEVVLEAGRHNMPVEINSSGLAGATLPVTVAGAVVAANTEVLAGLLICRTLYPQSRVFYSPRPMVFDMKTGHAIHGAPENILMSHALIELGKHYGLPVVAKGMACDSHACDEQAAIEKVMMAQIGHLCGANILAGAGSLSSSAASSLEQLVLDAQLQRRLSRIGKGFEIDSLALGVDAIADVGPKGHYLTHDHTLKYFRSEYVDPLLANRSPLKIWEEQGSKRIDQMAHEKVVELLKTAREPILDRRQTIEMDRIMSEAQEELR